MTEIWKDIEGFVGFYQISSLGRVKSLHRLHRAANPYMQSERILKPRLNSSGYLYVDLYNDGKHKRCFVHRLVALHFVPNPNNLQEVNHKDENKTNNKANNLEWCSRSYNATYGSKIARTKETCILNNTYTKTNDKRTALGLYGARKEIAMCDNDENVIKVFPSLSDAAKETGVNIGKICECCQGKRTKTRNHKWKYYE